MAYSYTSQTSHADRRKGKNETVNREQERRNLSKHVTTWEEAQRLRAERRIPLTQAWTKYKDSDKPGWKTSDERRKALMEVQRIKDRQYQELLARQEQESQRPEPYSTTLRKIADAQTEGNLFLAARNNGETTPDA